MKIFQITIVSLLISFLASAQEEVEWTTYYGEKIGYKIDFPDFWASSTAEEKELLGYSGAMITYDHMGPELGMVMIIAKVGGTLNGMMNGYKKVFEKDAKKKNDTEFQWIGEGKGKLPSGRNYGWDEYKHTFTQSNGESHVEHVRNYYVAWQYKMWKYAIRIKTSSSEENWEAKKDLLAEIFTTFDRYENK